MGQAIINNPLLNIQIQGKKAKSWYLVSEALGILAQNGIKMRGQAFCKSFRHRFPTGIVRDFYGYRNKIEPTALRSYIDIIKSEGSFVMPPQSQFARSFLETPIEEKIAARSFAAESGKNESKPNPMGVIAGQWAKATYPINIKATYTSTEVASAIYLTASGVRNRKATGSIQTVDIATEKYRHGLTPLSELHRMLVEKEVQISFKQAHAIFSEAMAKYSFSVSLTTFMKLLSQGRAATRYLDGKAVQETIPIAHHKSKKEGWVYAWDLLWLISNESNFLSKNLKCKDAWKELHKIACCTYTEFRRRLVGKNVIPYSYRHKSIYVPKDFIEKLRLERKNWVAITWAKRQLYVKGCINAKASMAQVWAAFQAHGVPVQTGLLLEPLVSISAIRSLSTIKPHKGASGAAGARIPTAREIKQAKPKPNSGFSVQRVGQIRNDWESMGFEDKEYLVSNYNHGAAFGKLISIWQEKIEWVANEFGFLGNGNSYEAKILACKQGLRLACMLASSEKFFDAKHFDELAIKRMKSALFSLRQQHEVQKEVIA